MSRIAEVFKVRLVIWCKIDPNLDILMNFFFDLKICFKWHKLNVLIKAITNEQNINRTHSYNVYTI